MKKSVLTIAILISGLFMTANFITGCSGKKKQATEQSNDHMKMDSTQTAYACPMHPEVTGKDGEKCSKCGMKLEPVKSADSTMTGHDH